MNKGTYISGRTPEALQSLCQPFIECGSHYHRVHRFSTPPILDSLYQAGLVFQAFTSEYFQIKFSLSKQLWQNPDILVISKVVHNSQKGRPSLQLKSTKVVKSLVLKCIFYFTKDKIATNLIPSIVTCHAEKVESNVEFYCRCHPKVFTALQRILVAHI